MSGDTHGNCVRAPIQILRRWVHSAPRLESSGDGEGPMSEKQPAKPSRRSFLQAGLLSAAGITALGAARRARAQEEGEEGDFIQPPGPPPTCCPNVLILMVDEQRYPTVYESAALRQFRGQYLV